MSTRFRPASAPSVNVSNAAWALRALNLMIAVVGSRSLVGIVLHQSAEQIHSLCPEAPCWLNGTDAAADDDDHAEAYCQAA